ncbi:hypothetical protein ACFOWM_05025 [Ferruginibacter yonginensis]|uniref:DUF1735 domain-containing protein n=1 Tax=Ferruginibacter yonginensis TaxID=1310416 RepID=A0ABV8QR06_9BACT
MTTISEKAYINTDAQNIGAGYDHTVANFNFTKRPTESVKFFTLKIAQARETKLNGPLVLKVTMTNLPGFSPLPANAITVTDITVPASTDPLIVFPVFFTVNKAALNVNDDYAVNFKLTSANQGAISSFDSDIDVWINYSDFNFNLTSTFNASDITANYTYKSSVVDPANQFGINNLKTEYLMEITPNVVEYADQYVYALAGAVNPNLEVNNLVTGARTALFRPRFTLNATGQVTAVTQSTLSAPSTAITNLALDPTGVNAFVYTSNNNRTLKVKYTFTLTTTINGVVTPRTVRVSEEFSYDPDQIYF